MKELNELLMRIITRKNKFFMFFKKLFIVPLIMETLYKKIHYSS